MQEPHLHMVASFRHTLHPSSWFRFLHSDVDTGWREPLKVYFGACCSNYTFFDVFGDAFRPFRILSGESAYCSALHLLRYDRKDRTKHRPLKTSSSCLQQVLEETVVKFLSRVAAFFFSQKFSINKCVPLVSWFVDHRLLMTPDHESLFLGATQVFLHRFWQELCVDPSTRCECIMGHSS